MSRHDDIDNQMRDAFAAARTATPTQREVSTVMRRLDKKPRFRFPKLRIAIAAPVAAAALLAGVVAVDSLRGDNDSGPSLVERAIAASTPRVNTITAMDLSMTLKLKAEGISFGDKGEMTLAKMKAWQSGNKKSGLSRGLILDKKGAPMIEVYHDQGHTTMYAKKVDKYTSFKGTKLPSQEKAKDPGMDQMEQASEEMMSDPQAFYLKALKGKGGAEVLGDTKVDGKPAHQLSMGAPLKLEDGMKGEVRIFIDRKTYKPLEMRVLVSEPKTKLKMTLGIKFSRYTSIPNTPHNAHRYLDLNVPKSAKKISPLQFEGHMTAAMMQMMMDEMMPDFNKQFGKEVGKEVGKELEKELKTENI